MCILTGEQIANVCYAQLNCTACPLHACANSCCTPLMAEIRIARLPNELYEVNHKVYEVNYEGTYEALLQASSRVGKNRWTKYGGR